MIKTFVAIILLYIYYQAVGTALRLLNQPSDLAILGGVLVLASTMFASVATLKWLFPTEIPYEEYDESDDPDDSDSDK